MRRIIASLVFASLVVGLATADARDAPVVIPSGVDQSQIPPDCASAYASLGYGQTCQPQAISAPPGLIEAGILGLTCSATSCYPPYCTPPFTVTIPCVTSQGGVVTTAWKAPCSILPTGHTCPVGNVCQGNSQWGAYSGICG